MLHEVVSPVQVSGRFEWLERVVVAVRAPTLKGRRYNIIEQFGGPGIGIPLLETR